MTPPWGGDDFLSVLWRRRVVVALAFLAVLGAVVLATVLLPKKFESTAYLVVSSSRPAGSEFEQAQNTQTLLATFAPILKTDNIANEVRRRLPPRADFRAPKDAITVEPVPDSLLIRLTAEASSPRAAQQLARVYIEVFVERARPFASPQVAAGTARLAVPATLPGEAARPRPALYVGVGVFVGLLAAFLAGLAAERMDRRFHVSENATEVFGRPIVGRIPRLPARVLSAAGLRAGDSADERAAAEAFRLLLANLAFAAHGPDSISAGSVAVISPGTGEGRSTCALGLARVASGLGLHTLLVEADLWRPRLAEALGHDPSGAPGFPAVLAEPEIDFELVARRVPGSTLDVLPALSAPWHGPTLLNPGNLETFEHHARSRYDLVIYDTPPLSIAADALMVATVSDHAVVVIDATVTLRTLALQASDQLDRVDARVLGVVINRSGHLGSAPRLGPHAGVAPVTSFGFGWRRPRWGGDRRESGADEPADEEVAAGARSGDAPR
jgi:Mrp family chromosome partitioning ATPase/capsular polysaccharide biosynthesis protein